MASPKKTKEKKEKKPATKAVAVRKGNTMAVAVKESKNLAWGGAMPKVGKNEEDQAKITAFCNQVAQIYGVPSLGVNAMGGNPYLNKDGRLYLLHELREGKAGLKATRKEFLNMSKSINEPAIIKVTLVFRDGHEVEAIGEASKESVKLDAVKQTLNMMAETRGLNRAIWQEVGHDVWKRVEKNLARAKMDDQEKARIIQAGTVSYEEMQRPERSATPKASSADELVSMALERIAKTKDAKVVEKIRLDAQGSDKINIVQKKQVADAAIARIEELKK